MDMDIDAPVDAGLAPDPVSAEYCTFCASMFSDSMFADATDASHTDTLTHPDAS